MTKRPFKDKKLTLTNDGQLSFFFVGVGSAFSKRHYQTNLLIVKGDDHLMVDCGTKTPQAFYELGTPITDIQNFYITHSHADHVGGLEEVMLMARYFTRTKPNIWITETYQHLLWDMSIRGGSAFNEEVEGKNLTFGDFWKVQRPNWLPGYPRETYEFNVGNMNVKAFRSMHTPSNSTHWQESFWSTGLIIDDRIFFSGDTKFDQDLIITFEERFNFEYIFHDCQFIPPGGVHASIEELKALPEDIKKKMILIHYGDNWEDNIERVKDYGFLELAEQWSFYDF
jgi:ribonuclease BN (tRNA processing enzyme)